MHSPELGNRLVVGIETLQQPHDFHIPAALCFQAPGRADLIQIAIEIKLQQCAGIVSRPASVGWFGSFESESLHVELLDKRVHNPTHVIKRQQVIEHDWKQGALIASISLDVTHASLPLAL
jgi:hypothetical protein